MTELIRSDRRRAGRRLRLGLAMALTVVLALAALIVASSSQTLRTVPTRAATGPNVIFILTDDLSWDLVTTRYMPHVVALERQGMTFDHYFVTDSLCCPSRSSIFTGLLPHNDGVFTNTGADGGYFAFTRHGLAARSFAVALRQEGYLTSLMGKYLNGYEPTFDHARVPPGWTDWHVSGRGYAEFDYTLNENGKVNSYGGRSGACGVPGKPDNYMVDVLAARGSSFIDEAVRKKAPFAMEIATFAPHAPYTPAERDACDFPGLRAPRDPSFDSANTDPPSWLRNRPPLPRSVIERAVDQGFRMRAQAVESVDRLIGELEAKLAATGRDKDTYIVFSSDNGYHMGQHRLRPGKQTIFDTDTRVPLIVAGPGVPHDVTDKRVVENIDLYPTLVELAGGSPSTTIDGHSLWPLLHPLPGARPWRTAALVEHHGPDWSVRDPDFENGSLGGNPSSYEAVRIFDPRSWGNVVYAEYTATGEHEFYDIDRDPFERHNTYRLLTTAQKARLHGILLGLERCHGGGACWRAAIPRP